MRKLFLLFLLGTLFSLTAWGQPAFLDQLCCMPVLIQIPLLDKIHSSDGTGVYLEESNRLFLVTAAHCIFNVGSTNSTELINSNALLSSLPGGTNIAGRATLFLDLNLLTRSGKIKRHKVHDVAIIEIGTNITGISQIGCNPGVVLLSPGFFPVQWDTKATCKTFEDVSPGSDSYVLGYPVNLIEALSNGQQSEIDFSSPLIRKGVISQKNNFTRKLIIDSAVYGGNSGGPVLIVEHPSLGAVRFSIVGIIIQYVPAEASVELRTSTSPTASIIVNSGYGVAEPIDYALELIRQ
jgi:hypothetical protein